MKPMCYICARPVQHFKREEIANATKFTIRCHGETQKLTRSAGYTLVVAFHPISAAIPDGTDQTGRRLPTNHE